MLKKRKTISLVLCHRKPERSFFYNGKQFPLCARCTGIYVGYFSLPFFLFDLLKINLLVTIVLILPTIIDGLLQAYLYRESNNLIRVTSGLLAGIGLMSLMSIFGINIVEYINTLNND